MKNERRNDKKHQQERLQAYQDANETIRNLHHLVDRPGRTGLSVGQMVNVAAAMGLLSSTRRSAPRYRSPREKLIV